MTAMNDKAGETGNGVAEPACTEATASYSSGEGVREGRDAVTREVCRGVGRLLQAMSFAIVTELPLPNGRRADVVGLSPSGDIWIVEVKSCLDDLRVDAKWPEYRDYSDALFFAVAPSFPREALPDDTGLILADRYGGEIIREAPLLRLAGARRKAMTLRFARSAAFSLQLLADPSLDVL
ncbi:MmcB family DNA repair protein [Hyphomicrobium sp. 1Nfss2.1]|uniref:MmcB family DNA repair protein n=1 Tax=Hyphomicrobium sp. 1Nfss2.1 TaxID=3413936 RepID=UPI003C7EC20C